MRGAAYLRALETAFHCAGLPYGYAITVWSTGAVLIDAHGPPSVGRVFLFVAGAPSAFGGLRFLTETTEGEAGTQLTRSPHSTRGRTRVPYPHVRPLAGGEDHERAGGGTRTPTACATRT
jgi:hypothetical protein